MITHHVDVLRYAHQLPVEDRKAAGMEWDPADVKGFHDALRGYNVAAILYGHTHVRNVCRWDGSSKRADAGIPLFNTAKSSHFASRTQAFFYFEIASGTLTAPRIPGRRTPGRQSRGRPKPGPSPSTDRVPDRSRFTQTCSEPS